MKYDSKKICLIDMLHFDLCATLWKDTKNQNLRVIYTNYIPNLYVITDFFYYMLYIYTIVV